MGITIHFNGRIRATNLIAELTQKLCWPPGWAYSLV
jgi:hypothetical protein